MRDEGDENEEKGKWVLNERPLREKLRISVQFGKQDHADFVKNLEDLQGWFLNWTTSKEDAIFVCNSYIIDFFFS